MINSLVKAKKGLLLVFTAMGLICQLILNAFPEKRTFDLNLLGCICTLDLKLRFLIAKRSTITVEIHTVNDKRLNEINSLKDFRNN